MQESGENYLETILLLKEKNGSVRSIDIATALDYSKASISRAVGILKEDGYIDVDQGGYIELTDKGFKKASDIYERHMILTEFLVQTTGIDQKTADSDACRIEHVISAETFELIKKYVNQSK